MQMYKFHQIPAVHQSTPIQLLFTCDPFRFDWQPLIKIDIADTIEHTHRKFSPRFLNWFLIHPLQSYGWAIWWATDHKGRDHNSPRYTNVRFESWGDLDFICTKACSMLLFFLVPTPWQKNTMNVQQIFHIRSLESCICVAATQGMERSRCEQIRSSASAAGRP